MPGFRDGDFAISDSSAIIHYLEAVKPEPNLIPKEPKARRARRSGSTNISDTILVACGGKMLFNRIVGAALPRAAGRRGGRAQGRVRRAAALARLSGARDPGERLPRRGPARLWPTFRSPARSPSSIMLGTLHRRRHAIPGSRPMSRRSSPGRASRPWIARREGVPRSGPRHDRAAPVAEIASYHAHIYFEGAAQADAARRAARGGGASGSRCGWGPGGTARSARTTGRCTRSRSRPDLFATFVPWLMLNHAGLSRS